MVLLKDISPILVMPSCLCKELLQLAHSQGHFAVEKTLSRVKMVAWWPNMFRATKKHVQTCLNCVVNNSDKIVKGPMSHQPIVDLGCRIQMDFIGPKPNAAQSNKYCLVIVESFSKWVEAFPTKNNTASTTAKVLLNQTFSRCGLSESIDSEQGPHFVGEVVKTLCQVLGVRQKFHIAGHSQSLGLV